MERIIIEVDNDIAIAWRKASPMLRAKLEKEIEWRITQRIRESQKMKFQQLLDEVRDEASTNGLTQEALDDILNEES
ncbi:MAG: hypothetical protein QM610_11725 [Chitinophagaceae bacterium]